MVKTLGIVALTVLALVSLAQAGGVSLGIKAGLADPEHLDTALDLGGLIRGSLAQNWRLEGSIEYWGVEHFKDVSINGTAAYEIPVSGKVQPYLGFGTGAHIQSWEWDWWDHPHGSWVHESDSRTFLGLHFLGGADFELSRQTKIITEIKYALIPDDDGANALTITGGVAFKLK
jgi:opacity protein-like surface antigen